jgi:hypothetical protein
LYDGSNEVGSSGLNRSHVHFRVSDCCGSTSPATPYSSLPVLSFTCSILWHDLRSDTIHRNWPSPSIHIPLLSPFLFFQHLPTLNLPNISNPTTKALRRNTNQPPTQQIKHPTSHQPQQCPPPPSPTTTAKSSLPPGTASKPSRK